MPKGIGLIIFLFSFPLFSQVPAFYGQEKKVKVANAEIAYYRFGSGKPLVLVTGHGDTMLDWHPKFLHRLSQKHELIIFDYPGIGHSRIQGAYPDSMRALASLVQGFVQTQHIKKPDILGFSMGGSLVLKLLTMHGDDYHHAISVGGKAGGPLTVPPEKKIFALLSDPNISPEKAVTTLLFPPSARKQALDYVTTLKHIGAEKKTAKALQAQAKAVSDENQGKGITEDLKKVKNPVLIINGTEDVLTPIINALRIASAIPDAWLVRVRGAGHGVLFQKPLESALLIENFLQMQPTDTGITQ